MSAQEHAKAPLVYTRHHKLLIRSRLPRSILGEGSLYPCAARMLGFIWCALISILLYDLQGKTIAFHHCDIDQPQPPNFAALPKYVVLSIGWSPAPQGGGFYSENIVLSLKSKESSQKWSKVLSRHETLYVFL